MIDGGGASGFVAGFSSGSAVLAGFTVISGDGATVIGLSSDGLGRSLVRKHIL